MNGNEKENFVISLEVWSAHTAIIKPAFYNALIFPIRQPSLWSNEKLVFLDFYFNKLFSFSFEEITFHNSLRFKQKGATRKSESDEK